jgi:hypothetical protein
MRRMVVRGEREWWPCASTGLREFLEGEARNLGDDVINARLEARGGFARDVVLEFVEQVADGEVGTLLCGLDS